MLEVDPRPARIRAELGARKVIIVTGSKGGVGKTTIAALLSLALAERGLRPLLIDLDVTDPNMHVVLGVDVESQMPGETKGISPMKVHGVGFISIAPYTKARPAPLRGEDAVNAVRELLAATDYTGYDTIVIDTPPGLGDVNLELLRLVPDALVVVVTTPSKLSKDSLRRHLQLLAESGYGDPIVLYNMSRGERPGELSIPFDGDLEEAYGDPLKLMETKAYGKVRGLAEVLLARLR